jgi:hypothetical protein
MEFLCQEICALKSLCGDGERREEIWRVNRNGDIEKRDGERIDGNRQEWSMS